MSSPAVFPGNEAAAGLHGGDLPADGSLDLTLGHLCKPAHRRHDPYKSTRVHGLPRQTLPGSVILQPQAISTP
jgi:hypothetical protein